MISATDSQAMSEALRTQDVPENAQPTDEQLAAALRAVPLDTAARYLAALREQAREGFRCWELGHDHQIEHWRRTAIDRSTR